MRAKVLGGLLALAFAGCEWVLDTGAYRIVDRNGHTDASVPVADAAGEPDAAVEPACAPLEGSGREGCEPIGVPPGECGEGFESDGEGGCVPFFPLTDCVSTSEAPRFAWPGKTSCGMPYRCGDGFSIRGTTDAIVIYAAPDAAAGGNGSRDAPYSSIREALDAVRDRYVTTPHDPDAAVAIYLGEGTFNETVVVDVPVRIRGACAERTRIVGADPTLPVVTLRGAEAVLYALSISGGETGVAVEGGRYAIQQFWVHDVSRFGITVDDAEGYADLVAVGPGLVENVGERGIVLRGSTVRMSEVVVRDVGPADRSQEAAGIVIEPSRHAPTVQPWDPWNAARPNVESFRNVLVENVETGVILEGADVTLEQTVVRDVRFGIAARWRPLGPIPGNATVRTSLVERASEAAVAGWNASITLDRVTLRNSGADCESAEADRPVGSHPGNALRVRFDSPPEETFEPVPDGGLDVPAHEVRLQGSLVDGARQGGVVVEGGHLLVDHSIVRGVEAEVCTEALGDGVAVYAHDFSPASVHVTASRISGSARAALASFGAATEIEGLELDGNAQGMVLGSPGAEIAGVARCGSDGGVASCPAVEGDLEPAIVRARCDGVGESESSAPDCVRMCFERYFTGDLPIVQGIVVSMVDEPRIAPARTGLDGCATIGGVEIGRPYATRITGPLIVPSIGTTTLHEGSYEIRARLALTDYPFIGSIQNIGPWPGAPTFDLSRGLLATAFLCLREDPDAHVLSGFFDLCATGIAGAMLTLDPPGGAGPYYTGSASLPHEEPSAIGGVIVSLDVPPGDYEFTLHPPEGASAIECDNRLFGASIETGIQLAPDRFRAPVRGGYLTAMAYAHCVATP